MRARNRTGAPASMTAAELVDAVEREFGITLDHKSTPQHLWPPLDAYLARLGLDIVDYIRARCDMKLARAIAGGDIVPAPDARQVPRAIRPLRPQPRALSTTEEKR